MPSSSFRSCAKLVPVAALAGCMSYSSRVELRSSDSTLLAKQASAVQEEVAIALSAIGFKPVEAATVTKQCQLYYPDLVAMWSRTEYRNFLRGSLCVTVSLEVSRDLVLVLVNSTDQGDKKGVETTSALLKQTLERRFPE